MSLPNTSLISKDLAFLFKLIERIRAIGIYELLESSDKPPWDDFQKRFLLSISVQKLYTQLFEYFKGVQNIKTRDLLVVYAFSYYELADELKDISKQLIHVLHVDPLEDTYRSKLYQALHKFERLYVPWKMDDRSLMLEKLSHMYWEYEVNYRLYETRLTQAEKEYFLNEKKNKQSECIHLMKKIDDLNYFQQYQPIYVDSQVSELLIQTLRTAFWDQLKSHLQETPPNYNPLFSILLEIRGHLEIMTQRHPDILNEFDEYMDIEFMKQRLKQGSFTFDFWIPRIDFLFRLLIHLDSLEKEPKHKNYLKTFHKEPTINSCIECLAYFTNRLLEIKEMYQHVFSSQ